MKRKIAILAAVVLGGQSFTAVATAENKTAENKMGYRLETAGQASELTRAGGSLGMKIGPKDDITSEGLTFQVLKVEGVVEDSPAAQAGLKIGDQIIAVDGRVFPDTKTFAEYVGSIKPGQQIELDYMPEGGGPKQAQRVGVTIGEGGHATSPQADAPKSSGGLSTGQRVAIGVGAAAIFGCYEFDCFSKLKKKYEDERAKHSAPPGAGAAVPASKP